MGWAVALCLGACRFPGEEFESYQDRTDGIRGTSPGQDAGGGGGGADAEAPIQGAVPPEPIQSYYVLDCLSSLAPDPRQALRFRASVNVSPGGTGSSVQLTMRSLLTGATDLANVDPRATDISAAAVPIADNGRFDVSLGEVRVPDTSNAFSGAPLTVRDTVLLGIFYEGDNLCAKLDGIAEGQTTVDLGAGRGTPCIGTRFDGPTGPLPKRQLSDFSCNF